MISRIDNLLSVQVEIGLIKWRITMYNQQIYNNDYYHFNHHQACPYSLFEDFSEFMQDERVTDRCSKSYEDVIQQIKQRKNKEVRHENHL